MGNTAPQSGEEGSRHCDRSQRVLMNHPSGRRHQAVSQPSSGEWDNATITRSESQPEREVDYQLTRHSDELDNGAEDLDDDEEDNAHTNDSGAEAESTLSYGAGGGGGGAAGLDASSSRAEGVSRSKTGAGSSGRAAEVRAGAGISSETGTSARTGAGLESGTGTGTGTGTGASMMPNTGTGAGIGSDAGVLSAPGSRLQTGAASKRGANKGSGSQAFQGSSYWCLVKSKIIMRDSKQVTRKALWYEAKPNTSFSIGKQAICDLALADDRCKPVNAVLSPTFKDGVPGIRIEPRERMYQLVGMGTKKTSYEPVIKVGDVIKVSSISLQVTAMCTEQSDDFIERFALEIKGSKQPKKAKNRRKLTTITDNDAPLSDSTGNEAISDGSGSQVGDDGPLTDEDVEVTHDEGEYDEDDEDDENEDENGSDDMCYICWGGVENDSTAEDKEVDKKDTSKTNPLIRNPCGKCSGSSEYVHLKCLLTWIKSSGSGHCSICNGPLPSHFSCPPPNLELKVVRHRKGHSWVGTRRFRVSFAEKSHAIIGRDALSDVRLSDRTVGNSHAKIYFNRETCQFHIQDCSSLIGTFLLVKEPLDLQLDKVVYLKIGRALLTLRMTRNRGTFLSMFTAMKWGPSKLCRNPITTDSG
mmetsp:Transcript_4694/g.8301  ORF Transcript_4694/g.8301 Transcript_4694/m.8301 type:complete len:641 (+) Transcript_4694:579-2501(+)